VVYGANGYASYCNVRGYHYGTYPPAAAAAAYADGRSDSSSERGCYYASKYGRYSYRPSWSATKTD
jgi:hypothetical protein